MTEVVRFNDVTIARHRRVVVDRASFSVGAGQIHALLGHNGAGKTTLIRALSRMIRPGSGSVSATEAPAVLLAGARLPGEMTTGEMLAYRGRLAGRSPRQVAAAAARTGVDRFLGKRCSALSTGMVQRVNLAMALVEDAGLLVLDEPTTGIDPQGVRELGEVLGGLRAEGRTVLICSHDLSQLELVCDSVTCLRRGRVTVTGDVAEVGATVPATGYVIRTADDDSATRSLAAAGITVRRTTRGFVVGAGVGIAAVLAQLGRVEVVDVVAETALFTRIYERYAAIPDVRRRRDRRRPR